MKTLISIFALLITSYCSNAQWANQQLSNLISPTTVNQSLLPSTDNSLNLGSSPNSWKNIYFKGAFFKGSNRFIYSPNLSSTFVGTKAGNGYTTGYNNTGVGDSALYSNNTGFANTAFGYQTLYSNLTGSNNTAIGANADVISNNLTNATAIGANAKVSQSNSLVLGGIGSNGVNVGVGLSNPTAPGSGARSIELSAQNFPQYILQATGASPSNQIWRTIARNSNIFQIQTLDDNYTNEQTALQINRSGTSISTVLFPNGNIGIGTSTPTEKLNVAGNILSTGTVSGNQGNFPFITLGSGGVQSSGSDLYVYGLLPSTSSGTAAGNVILSTPTLPLFKTGNVGIGTTTPTLGKFVVEGMIGNTVAIFKNSSTTSRGLSLVTDNPGVYFNSYWNNGSKALAQGYAGILNFDPVNGNIYLGTSSTQAANAGDAISTPARLLIDKNGNVGIGANSPFYKLDVCGTIRAKEVLVQTGWCDYVFDKDFKLRSLNEVENYINQNKHLPDVPSATEIEDKGVKVAQMDSILIKKVEELTLYVIDQNKQIQQLQQKVIQLEKNDVDKKN